VTFQKGNRKASKLNGEQVLEIREKYAVPGVTQKRLALEYGVSVNTISSIIDGLTWRDVAGGSKPVNRPPLNPQIGPVDEAAVDNSMAKLSRMLSKPLNLQVGSFYDQPPPTEDEDNAVAQRATENFNKPTLQQQKVSDELDKLEKGD
jgi:hypothetical protein